MMATIGYRGLGTCVMCLAVLSVVTPLASAAGLTVWAIGEGVRINPLTGKAFEENARMLPGGPKGDYRSTNLIWDGKTISLTGAANEVLGCQIILEGHGVKGINVTAAALTGPGPAIPAENLRFFRAFYIHVNQRRDAKRAPFPLAAGWYPDPLVPLDTPNIGAPFAIDGSNFGVRPGAQPPKDIANQTVWADLWIPKGTPAGTYTGRITVASEAGSVAVPVRLQVFGFEIPDENHTVLELMSYSGFARIKPSLRDRMLVLAHRHRANVTNTKPIVGFSPELTPTADGTFDWSGFDKSWGPAIDGSLYTEGPRAGTPLQVFNLPFDPRVRRPDKGSTKGRNWPIPSPTKPGGEEVDFTPDYTAAFTRLLKDADAHFGKRYPHTKIVVFQDALDEPGFHRGSAAAAMAQLRSIRGYVRLFKQAGLKNTLYKLDIGSGFARCRYDLDGDGKVEGAKDVVDALGDVDLWNINGLCVDLEALAPVIRRGAHVWFYNGFEPRVGPTVISGEALGPRTWPWVVWNSNLNGMCVWYFLHGAGAEMWVTGGVSPGRRGSKHAGDAMFLYTGEGVGLPDRAFASMRLKAFRRGMQDYEYLHLLARADGDRKRATYYSTRVVRNSMSQPLKMAGFHDDATDEIATVRIEGDQRHWSHNPEDFEKIRHRIGRLLAERQ